MSILFFARLIYTNLKWLVLLPLATSLTVLFLTRDISRNYLSNTIIYTGVASGYDISTDESKTDFFAVNTSFDNMITTIQSRETTEEVAMQLLAQHLILEKPTLNVLGRKGFADLKMLLSDSLRKTLTVKDNFTATLENIQAYKEATVKNEITDLMASDGTYYSLNQISGNLNVVRVKNSDMIELRYSSTDPGVTQHTLFFAANTFIDRYKGLKGQENNKVIRYFEDELMRDYERLQLSEANLRDFGIENRIINYPEQSKYIAESKEELESEMSKEQMKFEAASASLVRLESKLSEQVNLVESSNNISKMRETLGGVQMQLSNARLYGEPVAVIDSLNQEAYRIQSKIRGEVQKYYDYKYSVEGVPINTLLDEWLVKVLEFEESKANLTVYEKRKEEFNKIYDEFAPLGSTLSRLEREVGINEQQYLSTLHGLNMARLREQNLEVANSLSVLDKPFFPVKAQSSKRGIMILGSGMGIGIMVLSIILLNALFDRSVKSPSNASEKTMIELMTALPERDENNTQIDYAAIEESLMEQGLSALDLALYNIDPDQAQYLIVVYSMHEGEGKSWFVKKIANKIYQKGQKTIAVTPKPGVSEAYIQENGGYDYLYFPPSLNLSSQVVWENLLQSFEDVIHEYRYIILELQAINKISLPVHVINRADYNALVLDANRSWSSASMHLNDIYSRASINPIGLVLNKVEPFYLESLIGEIPRKRNFIRKTVKRLIKTIFG